MPRGIGNARRVQKCAHVCHAFSQAAETAATGLGETRAMALLARRPMR